MSDPIDTEPADPAAARQPRAAERILASARELFYRDGIRAVGVDEIVSNAGVTKPSLYRSFASKDELAAAYLRRYEAEFWARFNGAMGEDAADPKAQLLDYLKGLGERAMAPDYRGCGLSNAAIEYPEPESLGTSAVCPLVSVGSTQRTVITESSIVVLNETARPSRSAPYFKLLLVSSPMTSATSIAA